MHNLKIKIKTTITIKSNCATIAPRAWSEVQIKCASNLKKTKKEPILKIPGGKRSNKSGEAGYRSLCLVHAKHALYHLSYIPILICSECAGSYIVSFMFRTFPRNGIQTGKLTCGWQRFGPIVQLISTSGSDPDDPDSSPGGTFLFPLSLWPQYSFITTRLFRS